MRTSRKNMFYFRRWHSLDVGSLEHLIRLGDIYQINPYELLDLFVEVTKEGYVTSGPLRITLRKTEPAYVIFLLTYNSEIIAQIKMETIMLKNLGKAKNLCSLLMGPSHLFNR